jgi:hypothetical protein
MSRNRQDYDICNSCSRRNCRKKPQTVKERERAKCISHQPIPRDGWPMLDHMMSKDPAGTMRTLHQFGLGVVKTKKGFKTVIK